MKKLWFALLFLSLSLFAFSQKWLITTNAGITGYSGDLTQPALSFKALGPGISANLKYVHRPQIILRGGISWGTVAAYDKNNKELSLRSRNLSFKTTLLELNAGFEINLIDPVEPYERKTLPYVFGGIGLFHFNPYAYDNAGDKVFLKPLSTEGQGLPQYPSRKEYKLTQFCLPFGLGGKTKLGPRADLGLEIGFRKTFTDYIDDVSKTYADKDVLMLEKGPKSVEMSDRQLSGPGFPNKAGTGDVRGNSARKDLYYNAQMTLTIKIGAIKKKTKDDN